MTHLIHHEIEYQCPDPHAGSPFQLFAAREAAGCIVALFCRVAASFPPGSSVELSTQARPKRRTSARFPARRGRKTGGRVKMRKSNPLGGPAVGNQGGGVAIPARRIIFDGQRHERLRPHHSVTLLCTCFGLRVTMRVQGALSMMAGAASFSQQSVIPL